jgi:hypothetical protein
LQRNRIGKRESDPRAEKTLVWDKLDILLEIYFKIKGSESKNPIFLVDQNQTFSENKPR